MGSRGPWGSGPWGRASGSEVDDAAFPERLQDRERRPRGVVDLVERDGRGAAGADGLEEAGRLRPVPLVLAPQLLRGGPVGVEREPPEVVQDGGPPGAEHLEVLL